MVQGTEIAKTERTCLSRVSLDPNFAILNFMLSECVKEWHFPVDKKNFTNNPPYLGKQRQIEGNLVIIIYLRIKRRRRAFDWYQNRRPLMTLNGVMAVILR